MGARHAGRTRPGAALRGAVLAVLRPGGAARAGRMDPRRQTAGAFPDAAAQGALGRCAGEIVLES